MSLPTRNEFIYNLGVQAMKKLLLALLSGSIALVASFLIILRRIYAPLSRQEKDFQSGRADCYAGFVVFAGAVLAALLLLRMAVS